MGARRVVIVRHGRLVGMAVALLSAACPCFSEPAAQTPPRTEPPALETPVDFVEQAGSIDAAVDLLSRKLGIACAVLHPGPGPKQRQAAPEPEAAADPGATRPPERGPTEGESASAAQSFDFQQQPLREVLDRVGRTFGCGWTDVGGIYLFRPRATLPRAAPTRAAAAVERQPLPPSRPILAELLRLQPRGGWVDGARVPLRALSPEARGVAERMFLAHLHTEMHRFGSNVGPNLRAADETAHVSFPVFLREARVVAAPTPGGGRFDIWYPDARGASRCMSSSWYTRQVDAPGAGP